jgi:hypothetical protein
VRPIHTACLLAFFVSTASVAANNAEPSPDGVAPSAGAAKAASEPAEGDVAPHTDGPPADVPSDDAQLVVAMVNGEPIRLNDLFNAVREDPVAYRNFPTQWGRNEVLHRLIKRKLLTAAAREAFADDPDAKDVPDDRLRNRYQRRFLSPSTEVSESELRAFYTENKARFGIPPMARIRELFFPKTAIGTPSDPRATALSVHEQLVAGASFEEFAKEHGPDHRSRQAGGDRGFLSLVDRPQLQELAEELADGDISKPFELTTGFSIVQLLERRSGVAAPFDAVRDEVEQALIAERRGDLIAEFLTTQARELGVEILVPEYAEAWPSLPLEPDAKN